MPEKEELPEPPGIPDIQRQLRLRPGQWIGLPLLLMVPLLALFGALGDARDTIHARSSELSITVDYPTRYRYRMPNILRLEVTNTGASTIDTVFVELDTAFASRFSSLTAVPSFTHPHLIYLTGLAPGEARRVLVELEGEEYGRNRGEVRVGSTKGDTARIPLHTFILP